MLAGFLETFFTVLAVGREGFVVQNLWWALLREGPQTYSSFLSIFSVLELISVSITRTQNNLPVSHQFSVVALLFLWVMDLPRPLLRAIGTAVGVTAPGALAWVQVGRLNNQEISWDSDWVVLAIRNTTFKIWNWGFEGVFFILILIKMLK